MAIRVNGVASYDGGIYKLSIPPSDMTLELAALHKQSRISRERDPLPPESSDSQQL